MLDADAVPAFLTVGPLHFHPATGIASGSFSYVRLPPHQAAILKHLPQHRGEAILADTLARARRPSRA